MFLESKERRRREDFLRSIELLSAVDDDHKRDDDRGGRGKTSSSGGGAKKSSDRDYDDDYDNDDDFADGRWYRDMNNYNVTESISQPSLYVHQIRTTDMGGLTMRMISTITMGEILQVII